MKNSFEDDDRRFRSLMLEQTAVVNREVWARARAAASDLARAMGMARDWAAATEADFTTWVAACRPLGWYLLLTQNSPTSAAG